MFKKAQQRDVPRVRSTRRFLSALILGLATSFNSAASALSEEISYWSIPGHDAVFTAHKCEATQGICARVHYLNPQEPKIRELFSNLMDKADPLPRRAPPRVITDSDILSLCDYKPDVTTKEKDKGRWHGTFIALVSGRNYTVNMTEISDTRIEVKLSIPYLPFLGRTLVAERVDNPPPACIATRNFRDVLKLK